MPLARRLTAVRKSGEPNWLRPDGKSQVTVEYDAAGNAVRCPAIVVSTQHSPDISIGKLREAIGENSYQTHHPGPVHRCGHQVLCQPYRPLCGGRSAGDSGLTGRKIIVDTYGGAAAHGGGCFSGKDPTKVDRSAAYMARYVAKNLVAAGLARRCQVELAYAIGVSEPVSIVVDTFGTGTVSDDKLTELVDATLTCAPAKSFPI